MRGERGRDVRERGEGEREVRDGDEARRQRGRGWENGGQPRMNGGRENLLCILLFCDRCYC